jgi:uncharacterized protein (UPF0305 family)
MKHLKLFEDIDWEDWDEEEDENDIFVSGYSYDYYKRFIGYSVIIKKSSTYNNQNPIDKDGNKLPGKIKHLNKKESYYNKESDIIDYNHHIFSVIWNPSNYQNSYRITDLEII